VKEVRQRLRSLAEAVLSSRDAVRSARSSSVYLLLQILGAGLAYGGNVVLARLLGAAEFGAFTYVYNWRALLTVPGLFGLGGGTLRFVPAYAGQRAWSQLAGFLSFARRAVLLASLATATVTALVVPFIPGLPRELVPVFWWAAASLPLQVLILQTTNVLRGMNKVVSSQSPQLILQPLAQLALIAAFVLVAGVGAHATGAMIAVFGSCAIVTALVLALERAAIPEEARFAAPTYEPRMWMRSMAPLLWIQGVAMAMDRADVLVLGTMVGATEAGIYSAASRIASLVGFGTAAVSAWAAPGFSERHARGDHDALQDLVRISARLIFLFTLPATIVVWVLGRWLLGLFGEGFEAAFPSLVVLTVGQLAAALVGPVGFLLPMTGGETTAAKILAVTAALNVGLNVALVPQFGMEGAAAASSAARIVQAAVMAIVVWRRIRIRTTVI
jgi:O-antigen/teichoic acid export membrane protein